MGDPTLAHLRSLDASIAPAAFTLVRDARLAGIPLIITSGRRTAERQAELVRAGVTKTLASYHLTGHAFDVGVWGWRWRDLPDWFWWAIGTYGEALGLRWGGRFRDWDPIHFDVAHRL